MTLKFGQKVTAILKFQRWGNFYFKVIPLEARLEFEACNFPSL